MFARLPRGMRWQWRHTNPTIITFGSSTKVEGGLTAVRSMSFLGTLSIRRRRTQLGHSVGSASCMRLLAKTRGIRWAAILVTMMAHAECGQSEEYSSEKTLWRTMRAAYALSQYATGIHSATTCRRRIYSVVITRMVGFLYWAFCQSTFGSCVLIDTQEM